MVPGQNHLPKNPQKTEKDVLKQEKDILKQERMLWNKQTNTNTIGYSCLPTISHTAFQYPSMQIGRFNVKKWVDIRDSSRDGWIKEFMKQELSSGPFGQSAEKKKLQSAISKQLLG